MPRKLKKSPAIQNRWLKQPNIKKGLHMNVPEPEEKDDFLVSFVHLSPQKDEWHTLKEAESVGKLSEIIHIFSTLQYPVHKLQAALWWDKFRNYGKFPAHSHFTCPSYITEDANWSRLHITWKYCVIGHIVRNVFYVVFLDPEHKFYPTQKRS